MIDWWGPILVEYYAGTEGNGVTDHHVAGMARRIAARSDALSSARFSIVDEETGSDMPAARQRRRLFRRRPRASPIATIPRRPAPPISRDGWSTLGDIGYLDEDGYLYLTDRKAHTIICGGVNVYPQETEDVLIGHPEVLDAAVFGVPNDDLGEEVKAVVQLRDPARASQALEAELIAYARARISAIKCPRSVDFEPELPRTPTGKLLKRLLRDRYWPAKA